MLDPSTALDPSILLAAVNKGANPGFGNAHAREALSTDDKAKNSNGHAKENEQDPEQRKKTRFSKSMSYKSIS